jgi:AraC-like DNA-binding protein
MEQYEKIYLYKRIVKAKLFIDDYYTENIDLDNIADQANFSKFHFIRLFKSIYGRTPNNYLIKIRIDNAKILLAKGHSVLETSLIIGFDSPTSFTGMFKKITGKTPSGFQKEQEIKRNAIHANPLQFIPNCFAETQGWRKQQF